MYAFKLDFFLAAACLASSVVAQTKLKIMPLGDSITEITCWRTTVWDDLNAAGVADKIQFVGSMTNNPQNCKGNSTWDMHHEGHSGYLAIDIANKYLVNWLSTTKPDIVMFMLGTNDVAQQNKGPTEILAAYTKMVGQMRAVTPKVKIIVDLVIPISFGSSNTGITALNQAIPAWVKSTTTVDSPIVIADCATGFPTSDLRDGVHPNAAGDAIISSRIFPVLLKVIQESLGTATTPIAFTA
ncbi:uncharacterized protein BP5553_02320 [Venustampulla echinocandica]|uniref:SGNH hydrolase-type esterase domain-containing protein n=1 Tax=Venustampulla echinocandica TaxID=2656787 RepID=A0A370U3I2_9HELO|nr:uncharacterized protein BP5553_02320 [Venustampulla echinocandica]RDL42341.1 hypothetical protein BP5553_02320 [Venustampulla echinocandica]